MEDLWPMRVRTDQTITFGEAVKNNLDHGEIGEHLKAVADRFEAEEDTPIGSTLHPKEAFIRGFLNPILANPLIGLRGIIDFNPSEGQVIFNEDDVVMEEIVGIKGRAGMTDDDLKGMTVNQRADRIKAIVDCTFCNISTAEGNVVIRLFATAKSSERAQIYRLVEGHAWSGDWKEGFFTGDDEIYNGLDSGQLTTLRDVINGKELDLTTLGAPSL
jgi:hypothetical protein